MHKIPPSGRDDIFFIYAMEFWFRLGRVGMSLWYFIHSVSKYALLSNLYHEQAPSLISVLFYVRITRTLQYHLVLEETRRVFRLFRNNFREGFQESASAIP
uniref:Uncharacterized protein n=1 Tax=Candidatus Kentrum sp. LPFa TaxID=2126335 RepID=A0A450WGX4_9GAMM|nr:MAG: hypothetical protein BECKLPF1236B_GA0070989_10938 [Candidatus Kentron sp. LPFa]